MSFEENEYIRHFPPHKAAERALVFGGARRAVEAAALLENAEEIWNVREFLAFTGVYEGKEITVCSHGLSSAAALLIFENLFNAGVKTVIRAGTCGGFQDEVKSGDILIGTGSVREDRVADEILPIEYPAIADRKVIDAIEGAATEYGYEPHVGMMRTTALFSTYPHSQAPVRLKTWKDVGVLGDEGEYSALLILAAFHKVRAGGLFVADGNVSENKEPWLFNTGLEDKVLQSKKAILKIGISALSRL
jgi:uridine phosphorylase